MSLEPFYHLDAIEVEPSKPATASVIWLHGLGADGHDFAPVVPELNLPENTSIRFIFPHAPSIPVTVNNGYVMPAWYDILEMTVERKVNEEQLIASSKGLTKIIERELSKGIPSEKILLIGFSQGGAVAYQTALSYDKPLAGLLALSTYFATAETIQYSKANEALPIYIQHGIQDSVVLDKLGRKAHKHLSSLGYPCSFQGYNMEHNVCPEQLLDLRNIIIKLLSSEQK
jgi:phospholipase/carboxylesterase